MDTYLHCRTSFLALTVSFCLACAAQAQTPDTTSAWRYFPLEIGNVWEYSKWFSTITSEDTLTSYLRWSVIDTLKVGDMFYHVVREEHFAADRSSWLDSTRAILVRFDTLSTRLLARDSTGAESGWPFNFPCPLSAEFGSFIECRTGQLMGVFGDTETVVGTEAVVTTVKIFQEVKPGNRDTYDFAADLGLSQRTFGGHQIYDYHRAEYVRVGGVEYGDPTGVSVEVGPEDASLMLAAYPNPARGPITVAFELPAASVVTLAVYDLLGREVARLVVGRPAGEHRAQLDVSVHPAGVYVIRLEAAGLVEARTLSVVR